MKAWVALIEGTCFFFSTEKEAVDFIVEEKEAGAEEWIDSPELLEASTDKEFKAILNFVCEGLQ